MRPIEAMRAAALCAMMLGSGCKTVTLTEQQFLDPRPAVLPDSMRGSARWHSAATFSDGFVRAGGDSLYYALIAPERRDVLIFYLGGSNYQIGQDYRRIVPLMQTGAAVFTFDYPGYGRSSGTASLEGLQAAGLQAYDAVQRITGIPPERIIVHGHSLGSMLAMYISEHRFIGGVVLEGPATNARAWAASFVPWYARPFVRFRIPPALATHDNLDRVRKYRGPLLILAGEKDRETRPTMARALHEQAVSSQKDLVVLPGTGHLIIRNDERALEPYRQFVKMLRRSNE